MTIKTRGLFPSIRLLLAGILDHVISTLGLGSVYVPLAGPRNSLCIMPLTQLEMDAYQSKHPKDKAGGWENKVPARIALEAGAYSPLKYLPLVKVPVHMTAAANDTLCPLEITKEAASVLGIQLTVYPVDHFSLYSSPTWEEVVRSQLEFMCKVTGLDCPVEGSAAAESLATAKPMQCETLQLGTVDSEQTRVFVRSPARVD